MGFDEAMDAIGEALIGLVDPANYGSLDYPYPDDLYPEAGLPSVTVRWDGITADGDGNPDILVPAGFRYEVRIYHPNYPPAEASDQNAYQYAQGQIKMGTKYIYEGIAKNRNLSGLVLDIIVDGSVAGDLVEPRTDTEYYGHEMLLDVRLHAE